MMFQGLQRGLSAQPLPAGPGAPGPMPGNMPGGMPVPQGARPPMPGAPGGPMGGGAPWQGMGNGWLQALRGMGQQMQAQPQAQPDPTVRGPGAQHPGQRPDPVAAQAQAMDQQARGIARQQQGQLVAQDDPRFQGFTR